MNDNQKLTPKYWVGHSKKTDDVFLMTAAKQNSEAAKNMEQMFGEDWFMDENFDIILIEIKEVKLK
jgi:hypothetical protein